MTPTRPRIVQGLTLACRRIAGDAGRPGDAASARPRAGRSTRLPLEIAAWGVAAVVCWPPPRVGLLVEHPAGAELGQRLVQKAVLVRVGWSGEDQRVVPLADV